jgi:hypothetical protein
LEGRPDSGQRDGNTPGAIRDSWQSCNICIVGWTQRYQFLMFNSVIHRMQHILCWAKN